MPYWRVYGQLFREPAGATAEAAVDFVFAETPSLAVKTANQIPGFDVIDVQPARVGLDVKYRPTRAPRPHCSEVSSDRRT